MALAAMEDLPTDPQRNRLPCLLVRGRTGLGETMIRRKVGRDHLKLVDRRLGLARAPLVAMQLPPEPAEVPFHAGLMGALGLPWAGDGGHIRA